MTSSPSKKSFPHLENNFDDKKIVAKGFAWRTILDNDKYICEYISGELAGREKSFEISEDIVEKLISHEITFDALLRSRGLY